MNNTRRKQLLKLAEAISEMVTLINDIREELEEIKSEEEEAYYNMPESIQESDRGQTSQEAQENIDSAIYELDNLESTANEIQEYIENATY